MVLSDIASTKGSVKSVMFNTYVLVNDGSGVLNVKSLEASVSVSLSFSATCAFI